MDVDDSVTCPKCGHDFYDDWERSRHALGKHTYRSWTKEDRQRKGEEMMQRGAVSARQRE